MSEHFQPQWERAYSFLKGHSVVEFGAGDLHYAEQLAMNGCPKVLAIDKEPCPLAMTPFNLQYRQGYFEDISLHEILGYTAALVSWPNVYNVAGLPDLLRFFNLVVYRGFNFDGTICGSDHLWEFFRHREVLLYFPMKNNVMIVYGEECERRGDDDLYPEEVAATSRESIISYSDSEETLNQVLGK